MMRPLLSASQTEEKRKLEELRRALIGKAKNQKNSGCLPDAEEGEAEDTDGLHTEEGEAGQIEKTESLAEGKEQRASSHPRMQKENEMCVLKKKYKIGHLQ
ncbi:hypothetical protein TSUD_371070 [Trifolium subterraneum]|uniref:Uncharacterized protein n=1 Tax=Trifolium subterraneum TaxID=3900 RepID=A0A2Z6P7U5_TRISU|nr:hypothetical protein TSUD_371070 [Trifolium subterraneum]